MKNGLKNVFCWLYIAFCALCLPVYGIQIGTILLLLSAIMLLPIKNVKELWERLPVKWIKPIAVCLLFIIGVCALPTTDPDLDTSPKKVTSIETTNTTEPETTAAVEPTQKPTEEPKETATVTEEASQKKEKKTKQPKSTPKATKSKFKYKNVPAYSGEPYVEINNNVPYFTEDDMTTESYISLSELDSQGRCGVNMMCASQDTAPKAGEERGNISMVKPSGWHSGSDGTWQRGHLLGWQLSALNADNRNLITSTEYMNIDGFLPFENQIDDYIEETGNHVIYRVTPVFLKNELVCRGCLLEARSVEDNGKGVQFCVYTYNVQPNVKIDYATGEHTKKNTKTKATKKPSTSSSDKKKKNESVDTGTDYVINTNTGKFHYPSCSSVDDMKGSNRKDYCGSRDDLTAQGYSPCGRCHP